MNHLIIKTLRYRPLVSRSFQILCVLSLALCGLFLVRWVGSPRGGEEWIYTYNTRDARGVTTQHNVNFVFTRRPGISWEARDFSRWSHRQATVPYWLPVLLTLIAPAFWFGMQMRRRGRARSGLCDACGYDLRASKDRCPECGAVIGRSD